MRKALYIGVSEPSDWYREELLKHADISVLRAMKITLNPQEFVDAFSNALLEKESVIVLEESMPAQSLVEMYAMVYLEDFKKKHNDMTDRSIRVVGINRGNESIIDYKDLDEEEFEEYEKEIDNSPMNLIEIELKY
jgi:hypothetical protein